MKHNRVLEIPLYEQPGRLVAPYKLAELLGDLRYDSLADYLAALAEKLERDSESDGGRGRGKLAAALAGAAEHLYLAVDQIEDAWDICEPYMKEGE